METRQKIAAALIVASVALPGAVFAAQTCVSSKDTVVLNATETIENATTTCETTIDENATATPEYQELRSNDIKDRNSAYVALSVCGAIFLAIALVNLKR